MMRMTFIPFTKIFEDALLEQLETSGIKKNLSLCLFFYHYHQVAPSPFTYSQDKGGSYQSFFSSAPNYLSVG
jgi:hypothetical protein